MSNQFDVNVTCAKSIRTTLGGGAARAVTPTELLDWGNTKLLDQIIAAAPGAAEPIRDILGEVATLVTILEQVVDTAPSWYEKIVAMAAGLDNVVEIVEKAGAIGGLDGSTKQSAATAAALAIFDRVDKGHDGSKDRVKIPWVPSVVSDAIERMVVKYAVVFGIELIVSRMNRAA